MLPVNVVNLNGATVQERRATIQEKKEGEGGGKGGIN